VIEHEAVAFTEIRSRPCNSPVLCLDDGPALAADQELPGVRVIRMLARNE
jgi:hypothetical protein